MIKRYFTIIFFALFASANTFGQSGTNSPYTRFGIGEINRNGFNNSVAMGGIATGLRTNNQINYMNPAAVSAQDTFSFIFDLGFKNISKHLETSSDNASFTNIEFDHLAVAFPVRKWWFMSLGLTPYSKVGYNVKQTEVNNFVDTLSMNFYNYGEGGINQLFLTNSFNILDNLSFGFNINYLFGNIEQYSLTSFEDGTGNNVAITENSIFLKKFAFEAGLQYYKTFDNKFFYTVGVTYSNKILFKNNKDNLILSTSYFDADKYNIKEYLNQFGTTIDTISASVDKNYSFTIPEKYSIGFTVGIVNKLTVGLDYTLQNWSGSSLFDINSTESIKETVNFTNDHFINLGLEYIPEKYSYNNYLKRINYRLGFYYNKSYLQIFDNQINNYGITFGLGLPIINKKTTLNLSYVIGTRGTTDNNLIKESYNTFGINFTLYDFWFIKRKYQ